MTLSRLLPIFALSAACAAPAVAWADEAAKAEVKPAAQAGQDSNKDSKKEDFGTLLTPGAAPIPARVEVVSADVVNVRLDEAVLGDMARLTDPLRDADGKPTTLQGLAAGRPLLLQLGYYRCPVVCPQVLGRIAREVGAEGAPVPGRDYALVSLSLDPNETQADAAGARARFLASLPKDASKEVQDGASFATAPQDTITALATACGYHYTYLPRVNQFVHPDALVVLSSKGKIVRFLPGSSFGAAELAEAVAAAKEERLVRPAVATFWAKCFDKVTMGVPKAKAVMMAGGILMLLAMAGGFLFLRRFERRRRPPVS